jgi:hypothetical protein
VTPPQHSITFGEGDPHYQVIPDDAAAHSTLTEKGEAAEHLSFGEVPSIIQHSADAFRELFVVRHENRAASLLSVSHLLAVVASVELHETHVVRDGYYAKDHRPHRLAVRGQPPASGVELVVRGLEARARPSITDAGPLTGFIALFVFALGNAHFRSTRLNRRPRTNGCAMAGSFGTSTGGRRPCSRTPRASAQRV